jgi:hypothetical protein
MLKDYLSGHDMAYTEKLVDQDESARDEMMAASGGFLGVPFSVVLKDDGSKETIIGFDKGRISEVLGIQE